MEQQKRHTKISTPVDVSLDIEETSDSSLPSVDVALDNEEKETKQKSRCDILLVVFLRIMYTIFAHCLFSFSFSFFML
jgi:hypothetical protein